MLDRLDDVLEWVSDCPGNTTLAVGQEVRGTAHGHSNSSLYQWARWRLYRGVSKGLVKKPPKRGAARWELTKKGERYVTTFEPAPLPKPKLTEVHLILRWMERGCPVYLVEGDEFARSVGNSATAAECYKQGLAALDGIIMFGGVWKRDWLTEQSPPRHPFGHAAR